jgi:hypothetical protein
VVRLSALVNREGTSMTQGSQFWRIGSAVATGLMLTTLMAMAVWTGVAVVTQVGGEFAAALRWASPGL